MVLGVAGVASAVGTTVLWSASPLGLLIGLPTTVGSTATLPARMSASVTVWAIVMVSLPSGATSTGLPCSANTSLLSRVMF